MISAGVGSYEWDSIPAGNNNLTSTLSPPMTRAKSYCGNNVVTILTLSETDSVVDSLLSHPTNRTIRLIKLNNNPLNLFTKIPPKKYLYLCYVYCSTLSFK